MPLSVADYQALLREATAFLEQRYDRDLHRVACVLQTEDGFAFGLHLNSSGHDVCAEAVAVGIARSRGPAEILACVSVAREAATGKGVVVSPCGDCRQLLLLYAPSASVIVGNDSGQITVLSVADLLPHAYQKPQLVQESNGGDRYAE